MGRQRSLPTPKVAREKAIEKLQARIEDGKRFLQLTIETEEAFEEAERDEIRWSKYNEDLLRRIFGDGSLADEYVRCAEFTGVGSDWRYDVEQLLRLVRDKINNLQSVCERLELMPETNVAEVKKKPKISGTTVFVVHGHDDSAKDAVARTIEKLGLSAIILHEQASRNQTIIEKFERHSDVAFAVVLLTPDDIGYAKDAPSHAKPRARQNVVLELGYFLGKLGRERVCALLKDEVEIPSDYAGVIYTKIDPAGAWRLMLAKELKEAGLPVDLNKV